MSCRQQINQYQLHPRHKLPRDTHLDIAETLGDNLRVCLAAIHPEASDKVLKLHAEEIVDQAYDALSDLAQDIDALELGTEEC